MTVNRPETISAQTGYAPGLGVAAAILGGLFLAIPLLFFETTDSMVTVWVNSRTFGHCFLILPIAGYLVWLKRPVLRRLSPRASPWGLVWIALAAGIWHVGYVGQVNLIQHFGLVAMLQGAVIAVLGLQLARQLLFPIGYLLFMVPFGDFAIAPLQTFTAEHTTNLVRWTGVPVHLENWILTIPGGSFLVAETCAGVRFLIASLALGVLIAGLFFERWWKRIFFLILSAVVPIIANVIRAYGIVMIAHLSDFEMAVGVDHLVYGFIFLSFVMAILIAIAYALRDPDATFGKTPSAPSSPADAGGAPARAKALSLPRLAGVTAAALALLVGARLYGEAVLEPAPNEIAGLRSPAAAGWTLLGPATGNDWRGSYPSADAQATWRYRRQDGETLSVFIAYYGDEGRGKELVSFGNRLYASDTNEVVKSGRLAAWDLSRLPPPSYQVVSGGGGAQAVWYWHWVDGHLHAGATAAKLAAWRAKLSGGATPSAVVAIAGPPPHTGTDLIRDFLENSELMDRMTTETLDALAVSEADTPSATETP